MSAIYTIPEINARLQVIATAIDAGPSSGLLKILDGSGNTLSTIQLAKPSTTISNGVMVFLGMPLVDPGAALGGTATQATVQDSTGATVITGLTVNAPPLPADIVMTPTNIIAAGQTIAIQQATITGH